MLVFPMAGVGFARADGGVPAPANCPKLSIIGPAGLPASGEIVRFNLGVDGEMPAGVRLTWTVVNGRLAEGQGTRSIGVRLGRDSVGVDVTATVKVRGLAAGCTDTASISEVLLPAEPVPVLLAEFSVGADAVPKARLRKAVAELADRPSDMLFIVEYFPELTAQASIDAKLDKIRSYLSETLKFDPARVKIAAAKPSGQYRKPLTKIYRVPPGAEYPVAGLYGTSGFIGSRLLGK